MSVTKAGFFLEVALMKPTSSLFTKPMWKKIKKATAGSLPRFRTIPSGQKEAINTEVAGGKIP